MFKENKIEHAVQSYAEIGSRRVTGCLGVSGNKEVREGPGEPEEPEEPGVGGVGQQRG